MTNQYLKIGIVVVVLFSMLGIGYSIFENTFNANAMMMNWYGSGNTTKNSPYYWQSMGMMQNPQYMNQWMAQNPQYMTQWMSQHSQYMNQWMAQNPQYMNQWMGNIMKNPQQQQRMYDYMFQNQQFMYGMMSNQNFQNNYLGPWLVQNHNFTWHGMMWHR